MSVAATSRTAHDHQTANIRLTSGHCESNSAILVNGPMATRVRALAHASGHHELPETPVYPGLTVVFNKVIASHSRFTVYRAASRGARTSGTAAPWASGISHSRNAAVAGRCGWFSLPKHSRDSGHQLQIEFGGKNRGGNATASSMPGSVSRKIGKCMFSHKKCR